MKKYMKSIVFVSLVGVACFFAGNANATGSAGCGLGSVVFKGNEWWKQIFAATTNDLTLTQFLGITSGTSNCASGLFGEVQKQQDYLVANLVSIQKQAAQGNGAELNGLASVLGCEASSFSGFGIYTQEKYSDIFKSQDVKQILVNLKSEMLKNNELSNSCKLINI